MQRQNSALVMRSCRRGAEFLRAIMLLGHRRKYCPLKQWICGFLTPLQEFPAQKVKVFLILRPFGQVIELDRISVKVIKLLCRWPTAGIHGNSCRVPVGQLARFWVGYIVVNVKYRIIPVRQKIKDILVAPATDAAAWVEISQCVTGILRAKNTPPTCRVFLE